MLIKYTELNDSLISKHRTPVVLAKARTHYPKKGITARSCRVFAKALPAVMSPGSALRFAALVQDDGERDHSAQISSCNPNRSSALSCQPSMQMWLLRSLAECSSINAIRRRFSP